MNPVFFWSVPKKIHFLNTVYWLMFRNGILPTTAFGYVGSSFPRWQFNENIHPEFSKIYHHRGNSGQYSSNRAIVKFYRNCIQHFVFRETQDGAPKPNSLVAIHKLFVDHFEIMMPSIMLTEKICGRMRESIAVAEHVM
ncbi:hypothetical protein S83_021242 [Arachis hypogaea]